MGQVLTSATADPVQVTPEEDPWQNPHSPRANAIRARLAELQGQPVPGMYTPEEQTQRTGRNDFEEQMGMLAALSGDKGLGSVGGMVLQKALKARTPQYTDHGVIEDGEYKMFPQYAQLQKQQQLEKQLEGAEKYEGEAERLHQEARWKAADKEEADRRHAELMKSLATQNNAASMARVQEREKNDGETTQQSPLMINGRPAEYIKGRGYFTRDDNGNLQPAYGGGGVQGGGGGEPQAAPRIQTREQYGKAQEAYEIAVDAVGRGQRLLKQVQDNPGGFGYLARGTEVLPFTDETQAWVLSDKELQARAAVGRQAYEIINALAGAALSETERKKIEAFLPTQKEHVNRIIAKLRDAIAESQAQMASRGRRIGVDQPQAPAPDQRKQPGGRRVGDGRIVGERETED